MSALQGLTQLPPQVFHRERFLDEVHAFVQHTVMGDDVGGIAGHEQPLEIRIVGEQIAGQLPAIHLGHDHVGHQQVDLPPVFKSQTVRLAVGGGRPGQVRLVSIGDAGWRKNFTSTFRVKTDRPPPI